MKNLMAILARCENKVVSVKLVFDSREEMPTIEDIKSLMKKYVPYVKIFKLIAPPLSQNGSYEGNYFDALSYEKEHESQDFKTKVLFENNSLISDFKENPKNIWKSKEQESCYKELQTLEDYVSIVRLSKEG